ncbi:MAG: outer membrane protein assembly factor BamD [Alphaproteobacteria bacterium]
MTHYKKIFFILFVFSALCLLTSCTSDKEDKYEEKPVTELYSKAVKELEDSNFKLAAKNFEEVIRQHPYSNYATRAQIMAAYAHYRAQQYEDAVASVNAFVQLYPTHKDVPYAYYLKALCYYNQISSVERDQRMTQTAESTFQELIHRFPYSVYAKDAKFKLDLTREFMAGGHMDVARFYQTQHLPISALRRLRTVVQKYDRSTHTPEALYRLVEVYLQLGILNEAQASAAVLGHNFPHSEWYKKAYNLLEKTGQLPDKNDKTKLTKTWENTTGVTKPNNP